MIKLFFRDNRDPVELEPDDCSTILISQNLYVDIDGWVVCRNDIEDEIGQDLEITDSCSHIEFENGKFIWEENNI